MRVRSKWQTSEQNGVKRVANPLKSLKCSSAKGGHGPHLSAFLKGLSEAGYVDGQNVTIEYRWAENQSDRLPALVADLVHRQVAVIAATGTPAALAAKAATTTIPIVFTTTLDPVQLDLVTSINRPGSNVTGVIQTNVEVARKRLQLLHEVVPAASVIGLLVNPTNPTLAETNTKELQAAARTLGLKLHVLNASTERDFNGVFSKLIQLRAGGLVIGGEPLFSSWSEHLAALALHHAVPTIYQYRDFAVAGGLLSYGADVREVCRLAGNYTGRVLRGEKPADLPVQQATKVELYINLKTAKALGITVPQSVQSRADEVIE
jgi:putative tryptophan/tyrosine transport system substrate-binding protein